MNDPMMQVNNCRYIFILVNKTTVTVKFFFFSLPTFLVGENTGLTKPQYCGRQEGRLGLRAYKKPFNYICLVRLTVKVNIQAIA